MPDRKPNSPNIMRVYPHQTIMPDNAQGLVRADNKPTAKKIRDILNKEGCSFIMKGNLLRTYVDFYVKKEEIKEWYDTLQKYKALT